MPTEDHYEEDCSWNPNLKVIALIGLLACQAEKTCSTTGFCLNMFKNIMQTDRFFTIIGPSCKEIKQILVPSHAKDAIPRNAAYYHQEPCHACLRGQEIPALELRHPQVSTC